MNEKQKNKKKAFELALKLNEDHPPTLEQSLKAAEKIYKFIYGDDEKQIVQDKNAAIDENGKTVQIDSAYINSTSDETFSINHRKIVEELLNGIEDFKYGIINLENEIDMLTKEVRDKDEEIESLRNCLKKAEGDSSFNEIIECPCGIEFKILSGMKKSKIGSSLIISCPTCNKNLLFVSFETPMTCISGEFTVDGVIEDQNKNITEENKKESDVKGPDKTIKIEQRGTISDKDEEWLTCKKCNNQFKLKEKAPHGTILGCPECLNIVPVCEKPKEENHTKDKYAISYESIEHQCRRCEEYLCIGKDPQGHEEIFCPKCGK